MNKKKINIQRYAFLALILAGLACVAAALLGVVQGAIALKLFTPANPDAFKNALWISLALIVIGLAIYGILVPDKVRRFLTGRQARYGSNSLIMTVAVIGILFVANMLAFQNPKSWDLTEDQSHTLAPETLRALASLPDKVTAYAFYSQRLPTADAQKLLQDFKSNSKGKFDYQFIDPDTNPIQARQAGITGDGKIMLVMGTHKEIASSATESDLTRSLILLISPEARTIYFLTGDGEADINTAGDTAFATARTTLESKNYTVKTLNLLADNKVPDDAKAIVVAGPQKQLSAQEVSLLQKYVDSGGGLIVMEDPIPFTQFGNAPDPLAQYLTTNWSITLDNDLVIDLTNSGQELNATSASFSSTHPITQHMTLVTILPRARSLSLGQAPQNVQLTPLVQTSQQSWGETDFSSLSGKVQYDQGVDFLGPLTLAAAGENTTTKGHVVVFGNSLFATDQAFDAYGNGDIFVNSVDWAARQDILIQITPHTPTQRTFNLPSQLQWIMILLGSIFILPGLVIVAGIASWISRRRRG